MECAGKGSRSRCRGSSATRRCDRCGAVAYCSLTHQISHWSVHKQECDRLKLQMKCANRLNDFPFTFSREATREVSEKVERRCSFLTKLGIHREGMWMDECFCGESFASLDDSRLAKGWNLSSSLCPCRGPSSLLQKQLSSWEDYYKWRGIPFNSPVALLLHWPLTLYWGIQLAATRRLIPDIKDELCIHYLGPEKELSQLTVFAELLALFPGVQVHMEFIGPAIPKCRDGERIVFHGYAQCVEPDCSCKSLDGNHTSATTAKSSAISLRLLSGYYHDRYEELKKESFPHLIIAPNAGIAAYKSWLPTIELIKEMGIRSVFSDYCEEACHLAVNCISSVTRLPPAIPVQINPFRQPVAVEESGGVLAYTLLGIDYNESSGDCAFLILDPHYTGSDDLKKIVNGGWCGWKKAVGSKGKHFFLHNKFYNLLLPQRPNLV